MSLDIKVIPMVLEEPQDKNEHCKECDENETCWKDVFTDCYFER